jgi:hypothetical protein
MPGIDGPVNKRNATVENTHLHSRPPRDGVRRAGQPLRRLHGGGDRRRNVQRFRPRSGATAQTEGRLLVTLNTDFADVRQYPPGTYAGLSSFHSLSRTAHSLSRTAKGAQNSKPRPEAPFSAPEAGFRDSTAYGTQAGCTERHRASSFPGAGVLMAVFPEPGKPLRITVSLCSTC